MFERIKKYFEDNLSPDTIGPHYVEDEMFPNIDEEQESETATKKGGIVMNFKEFLARRKSQDGTEINMNDNTQQKITDDTPIYSEVKKVESGGRTYIACTLAPGTLCFINPKTKMNTNIGMSIDMNSRFVRS